MKKHIPNLITCGNILCGCIGIIHCFKGDLIQAVYWMGLGAIFDFFDGMLARLLKVMGDMGKELDSLADMVTFGVLPAFVLYHLILPLNEIWAFSALLIPLFSGLRLAKFNIDTRQTDSFIGLPTPANALFIGALPFIFLYEPDAANWLRQTWILVTISAVMSLLLVAELPLLALKFKSLDWEANKFRFILIIGAVLLVVVFQVLAIPLIIIWYVIISVLSQIGQNKP